MKRNVTLAAAVAAITALILAVCPGRPRRAQGETAAYALIGEGAVLYSPDAREAITTLPENYFVTILGDEDGEGFIPAAYYDLTGRVRAADVEKVDYEPKNKYALSAALTVANDGFDINVRSSPDHAADNVIMTIPAQSGLFFYGTTCGSTQIEALGNRWYYVRLSVGDAAVRGYVYSLYVTAESVPENVIEPLPPADKPAAVEPGQGENAEEEYGESGYSSLAPTPAQETIIIVALSLPIVIIMYLMFRAPKSPKKK